MSWSWCSLTVLGYNSRGCWRPFSGSRLFGSSKLENHRLEILRATRNVNIQMYFNLLFFQRIPMRGTRGQLQEVHLHKLHQCQKVNFKIFLAWKAKQQSKGFEVTRARWLREQKMMFSKSYSSGLNKARSLEKGISRTYSVTCGWPSYRVTFAHGYRDQ